MPGASSCGKVVPVVLDPVLANVVGALADAGRHVVADSSDPFLVAVVPVSGSSCVSVVRLPEEDVCEVECHVRGADASPVVYVASASSPRGADLVAGVVSLMAPESVSPDAVSEDPGVVRWALAVREILSGSQ